VVLSYQAYESYGPGMIHETARGGGTLVMMPSTVPDHQCGRPLRSFATTPGDERSTEIGSWCLTGREF
jgi:hypothetical protein